MLAGKREVAELLVAHGASLTATDKKGRTALMYARNRDLVECLLDFVSIATINAKDISGNTALTISLQEDSEASGVVELLRARGASIEQSDGEGRSVMMIAALNNHPNLVRELIGINSNLGQVDNRGKNIWHHLAKHCDSDRDNEMIQILLRVTEGSAVLDMEDEVGRTSLHWAVVAGNESLVKELLARHVNVSARDKRMRTPLHLAATYNRRTLVALLLAHGASLHAQSDGGWTPLHNACDSKDGSDEIAHNLVEHCEVHEFRSMVNRRLYNGRTPLHVAAEKGNALIVEYLLTLNNIELTAVDSFGRTPLLDAARQNHLEVVRMLAPGTQTFKATLSPDARSAAQGAYATIVDFTQKSHNMSKVQRKTVFDLLYSDQGTLVPKPSKSKKSAAQATQSIDSRWIHLPANNVPWCHDLLTRRFVEAGATDAESLLKLLGSFQHEVQGQHAHSKYMRPVCQLIPLTRLHATRQHRDSETVPAFPTPPQADDQASVEALFSGSRASSMSGVDNDPRLVPKQDPSELVRSVRRRPRKKSKQAASAPKASAENGRHMYMFMPYLHFETDTHRRQMQATINRVAERQPRAWDDNSVGKDSADETLIRAHLTTSGPGLHVRRTLDQFTYKNIELCNGTLTR